MRGVRQGEPLRQLSLALTMPGELEELQQLVVLVRRVAYADDTFLQASTAG
jgi:hypothetical protein